MSYDPSMPGLPADHLRLENLLAVTDAELGRLSVEEMLVELLDRVRSILDSDTAAVLLFDHGTGELVARAACGLEEEVRQGARIPIGTGFAGAIAATRQPVRIERVDQTTVANPVLWQKGIQVLLGVPLEDQGTLLGVLHVGRLEQRPFRVQDVELLQVVADRVSAALISRQLEVERAAATLLERSLAPGRPPACAGLRFAARYVPAEGRSVGGDWYDAFVAPSGNLWLVAGDAAGHGLEAAVLMGRARSTLRAYALLRDEPETVLELTDRKIQHFETDAMVTVVCMTAPPPFDRFRVASAGHLPPVVARPGDPAEIATVAVGAPLGTLPGLRRRASDLVLDPGGVALLFTDGLVERRDEPIDEGLERLRRAVVASDPETVAKAVMNQLVGGTVPDDDIALVVVGRSPD